MKLFGRQQKSKTSNSQVAVPYSIPPLWTLPSPLSLSFSNDDDENNNNSRNSSSNLDNPTVDGNNTQQQFPPIQLSIDLQTYNKKSRKNTVTATLQPPLLSEQQEAQERQHSHQETTISIDSSIKGFVLQSCCRTTINSSNAANVVQREELPQQQQQQDVIAFCQRRNRDEFNIYQVNNPVYEGQVPTKRIRHSKHPAIPKGSTNFYLYATVNKSGEVYLVHQPTEIAYTVTKGSVESEEERYLTKPGIAAATKFVEDDPVDDDQDSNQEISLAMWKYINNKYDIEIFGSGSRRGDGDDHHHDKKNSIDPCTFQDVGLTLCLVIAMGVLSKKDYGILPMVGGAIITVAMLWVGIL